MNNIDKSKRQRQMNTSTPSKKPKVNCSENQAVGGCSELGKSIEVQQQKLAKNSQRVAELQERVKKLKQEKVKKIFELDGVENEIRDCREHKEMLPLIKQLREKFKKMREELGTRFYYQEDDIDVDEMSYEQLLELGDKIGKVSKGLSEAQFSQLERVTCSSADEKCLICQDNLAVGSECVRLKCGHCYDTDCLKEWFKMEKVCPLCKSESI